MFFFSTTKEEGSAVRPWPHTLAHLEQTVDTAHGELEAGALRAARGLCGVV